ncbi:AP2/ERF domain-containing protein [Pycnococcus provasolii]
MRDRAWRDLGKDPSKLNFDDTVPIPDEYLASVAKASKKLVGQQTAQQPSSAPSAENEDDGGALLEAAQHEHEIPLAADDDDEDGGALLEAAQHDHEVPPAAASSPTTTIINNHYHYHYHYHYNIHSGASATFHINNNSSPAAAGIPNTHHHVAQSPSAE